MRRAGLYLIVVLAAAMAAAGEYKRPTFDKTPFVKAIWAEHQGESITHCQTPFCFDRQLAKSSGNEKLDFAYLARKLDEVGVSGVFMFDTGSLKAMVDGFALAGNGKVAATVLGNGDWRSLAPKGKTDDATIIDCTAEKWISVFTRDREMMLKSPGYARVGGKPVVGVYVWGPFCKTRPELFAQAVERVEKETFPCVWFWVTDGREFELDESWVPVVDGVTFYTTPPGDTYAKFRKLFREKYPEKVFMPVMKPKWHGADYGFTGYDSGDFTASLRKNFESAFAADGDAICLNELAEFQEQSQIVPTYQTWDTWWRVCREYVRQFKGEPRPSRSRPELFLSSLKDLLVGDLFECEILGFGIDGGGEVGLDLRLADETGKEFFRFPRKTLDVSKIGDARFVTPTSAFTNQLALIPELRYTFNGEERGPYWFRPTRLWIGNVPSDEIWSTPVDRASPAHAERFWMTGIGRNGNVKVVKRGRVPEGQSFWPRANLARNHDAVFAGGVVLLKGENPGMVWHHNLNLPWDGPRESRLLVNGWNGSEINLFGTGPKPPMQFLEYESLKTEPVVIPFVGENGVSETYLSLQPSGVAVSPPITVIRDERLLEPCEVQIALQTAPIREMKAIGKITTITVPEYRVPRFEYDFETDTGSVAFDTSGNQHHGWLGGNKAATGPGTCDSVNGYAFQNYGWHYLPPNRETFHDTPKFVVDQDGRGAIEFDGQETFAMLPPRTQPPLSETIEIVFKPERTGRAMTLACSAFGTYGRAEKYIKEKIALTDDLRPVVVFQDEFGRIESGKPVPAGAWTRLTLTSDCEKSRLYLNGKLVAEGRAPISNFYRRASFMAIGVDLDGYGHAYSSWQLDKAKNFFKGRIRRIRVMAAVEKQH